MTQPKKKLFAKYFSPGTLFAETSERALEDGSLEEAVKLAAEISERHGALPYAFDLVTYLVAEPVDDGQGGTMNVPRKEIGRDGRYFLGGEIIRYEEAVAREGERSVWASNMMCNGDPVCVQNTNSYKSTHILREQDVILDPVTAVVLFRGDDPELVKYRAEKFAEWKRPA